MARKTLTKESLKTRTPVSDSTLRHFGVCLFAFLSLTAGLFAQSLSTQEQAIATMLSSAPLQQRAFLKLDPILEKVARARAADMAARHYFAHVNPDGVAANYLVRQAGYQLPASWSTSPTANYIESIGAGYTTPAAMWSAWMASPDHKTHLLGQQTFFAEQTSYGVGFVYNPGSQYGYYWVVITAPPQPNPPLTIDTPAPDARVTSPDTTASGTTSGDPAPASVVWRLENAGATTDFQPATGVTNWTAQVSGLTPGPNTLRVRSLDGSASVIAEKTRIINYVVLSTLTVTVSGSGSVTQGFAGATTREVGAGYTLTATPAPGFVFAGWSGGASTSERTLIFTMQPDLALTANFVPNPFIKAMGGYNGLLDGGAAGFASVFVNATGGFSGKISFAGVGLGIKGHFDDQGNFQTSLPRTGKTPLIVTLHLDLTNGTEALTGTISDGSQTASLNASHNIYSLGNPAPSAGRYTVVFAPDSNNLVAPQGSGFATLVVNAAGVAQLAGLLANGTPFVSGAFLQNDGTLPVFAPLYRGRGSLFGALTFQETGGSDVDGALTWINPDGAPTKLSPVAPGFIETLAATGAHYLPPLAGTRALALADATGNALIELGGGGLATDLSQTVTLTSLNTVTALAPNPAVVTMKLSAGSGLFAGSFLAPGALAPSKYFGVLLQKQNAGFGFFPAPGGSGSVRFGAAK